MINLPRIPENLIEKIESIPVKPGIYQMMDIDGNIIYVGKSKTLKSRVKSYFYTEHKLNKIKRMVCNIHDIDYIVTDTHLEAQILECALIKKLKPIYNKQFKNDKKYMYLKIENYNRFKPISMVYDRQSEYCFGPYRNKNILLDIIKFFQNIYPITKFGNIYEFKYKILLQSMDRESFEKNKECLIEIFYNKECMLNFLSDLQGKMERAASELQFEMATIYRDMINHIKYLYDNNTNESHEISDKILMGEKIDDGYKIFYISKNRIILKKKYKELTKESIGGFLKQAQELEIKVPHVIDEKRDLDFKKIVNREVKDEALKAILFIHNDYNLDEFINNMC